MTWCFLALEIAELLLCCWPLKGRMAGNFFVVDAGRNGETSGCGFPRISDPAEVNWPDHTFRIDHFAQVNEMFLHTSTKESEENSMWW
jgi:hypothetical protein